MTKPSPIPETRQPLPRSRGRIGRNPGRPIMGRNVHAAKKPKPATNQSRWVAEAAIQMPIMSLNGPSLSRPLAPVNPRILQNQSRFGPSRREFRWSKAAPGCVCLRAPADSCGASASGGPPAVSAAQRERIPVQHPPLAAPQLCLLLGASGFLWSIRLWRTPSCVCCSARADSCGASASSGPPAVSAAGARDLPEGRIRGPSAARAPNGGAPKGPQQISPGQRPGSREGNERQSCKGATNPPNGTDGSVFPQRPCDPPRIRRSRFSDSARALSG
jgi:hypothetical protein